MGRKSRSGDRQLSGHRVTLLAAGRSPVAPARSTALPLPLPRLGLAPSGREAGARAGCGRAQSCPNWAASGHQGPGGLEGFGEPAAMSEGRCAKPEAGRVPRTFQCIHITIRSSPSPGEPPRRASGMGMAWLWHGGAGGAAGAGSGRCRRRLIPSGPDSSGGYARAEGSCSLPEAKAAGQGVGNVAPPSPIRWERRGAVSGRLPEPRPCHSHLGPVPFAGKIGFCRAGGNGRGAAGALGNTETGGGGEGEREKR